MPIARKPNRTAHAADPAVDIDALINRGGAPSGAVQGGAPSGAVQGGAPSGAAPPETAKPTPILLRMPADLMARLDAALESRPVKLPRHTWILEAIHEKLTREAGPQ